MEQSSMKNFLRYEIIVDSGQSQKYSKRFNHEVGPTVLLGLEKNGCSRKGALLSADSQRAPKEILSFLSPIVFDLVPLR